MKCRKCKWFEWEDENPHCIFGIEDIEDIDDFSPRTIHEKDKCSLPEIELKIRFNGPYGDFLEDISWLCPENIRLILRKICKNTRFEVDYSNRFKRKLKKWRCK